MKHLFLIVLCVLLSGCQIYGVLATGVRKVTTALLDDRSLSDDMYDTQLYITLRDAFVRVDPKLGLDVEPTVFEGTVLLTGAVPNIDLVDQIVEISWRTQGVRRVYNYIRLAEPPSLETVNTDAAISAKIRTELIFTSGIPASNYKLTMENGVVYIMGIAQNKEELELVIATIKRTVGVQKVIPLVRYN